MEDSEAVGQVAQRVSRVSIPGGLSVPTRQSQLNFGHEVELKTSWGHFQPDIPWLCAFWIIISSCPEKNTPEKACRFLGKSKDL